MSGATNAGSDSHQPLNKISNGVHLKQKRARSQLSCIPCRAGKLKCNRAHGGCDQCVKRGREAQCSYVPPPKKQNHAQNVSSRVRQLESLVVDLMNQQTQNGTTQAAARAERPSPTESRSGVGEQPSPPSDNDSVPLTTGSHGEEQDNIDGTTKPFGKLRISKSGGEISYVGETHWQAILNGISDLKKELGDEQEEVEQESSSLSWGNGFGNIALDDIHNEEGGIPQASSNGLGLMIGSMGGKVTREQLVQSVPEKKTADRLCALWFNSPDPFKPIIHGPTFQDQYRAFWCDPNDTPTMWLGLLFSILSLASSFKLRDVDPSSQVAKQTLMTVNRYHTLAGSAAVLADFTKPKAHTMECLMLYGAGLRSNDAFVNVWLILGLIVRIGLRMGYHREHPDGISVFDAEMRRRVWAIISMIDVLISFQLGLPGMVKTIQSDAQPPRNLLDRDFNIYTTVLPPGRGIDELTPSSYTRAKLKIVNVFSDVNELIHAIIPPSHEQMMELDRRLDEAKAAIPPLLRMPDMSELVTDPAEQLMCRCNLDLLYLKTKMVLHRRYMEQPFASLSPQEQQMGIGYSRKSCVDAALRVLQHHAEIFAASQPGGQLESVKWYMGSISTHDYLLAAMIVCLELSQQIGDYAPRSLCPLRAGMMNALEQSQKIWSATTNQIPSSFNGASEKISGEHMYSETQRASQAMSVMLEKVRARFPQQADALRKLNESRAPQRPGDSVTDFSQPENVPAETASSIPFGGIISYHTWDNPEPESLQYNVPDTNGSTASWLPSCTVSTIPSLSSEASQPSTNDTSPDSRYNMMDTQYNNTDIINNMLDVPGAIDWEMFDTGMTKKPSAQNNMIAGNVLMNGGTGPGAFDGTVNNSSSEGQAFPDSFFDFSDMSMDFSGNVDLDMGSSFNAAPMPWDGLAASSGGNPGGTS